jgi:hypothetical protein
MNKYEQIKKTASADLSAWQRVNGLSMLEVLSSGDNALVPLLTKGKPFDFAVIDINGNITTLNGLESFSDGVYSTFGTTIGKRSYIAVSPLVAAHAAVFTQRMVHCCYDVANIWDVAKDFDEAPVIICASIDDVQEADSLKFEQLMFNAKNNTVNRRLWKPFEYMDEREKVNDKERSD